MSDEHTPRRRGRPTLAGNGVPTKEMMLSLPMPTYDALVEAATATRTSPQTIARALIASYLTRRSSIAPSASAPRLSRSVTRGKF